MNYADYYSDGLTRKLKKLKKKKETTISYHNEQDGRDNPEPIPIQTAQIHDERVPQGSHHEVVCSNL